MSSLSALEETTGFGELLFFGKLRALVANEDIFACTLEAFGTFDVALLDIIKGSKRTAGYAT